jgi:hypothetical protein
VKRKRAEEKTGCGVAMFYKVPNPESGTPIVRLRRYDLSEDDFDWRKAVQWAHRTENNRWLDYHTPYMGFRRAIEPIIAEFRRAHRVIAMASGHPGELRCEVTGEWRDERDCQIDHQFPATFSVLLAAFVRRKNLDFLSVETRSTFPIPGRALCDESLRAEWVRFHAAHARLRVLSKEANIAESKKSPGLIDMLTGKSPVDLLLSPLGAHA